jgi:hypothetical protein
MVAMANGPCDQFVILTTLAKMPENGSLRQAFLFDGEIRNTYELHSDISGLPVTEGPEVVVELL